MNRGVAATPRGREAAGVDLARVSTQSAKPSHSQNISASSMIKEAPPKRREKYSWKYSVASVFRHFRESFLANGIVCQIGEPGP